MICTQTLQSSTIICHFYLFFSSLFFSELEVLKFLESYPKYSNANSMHPDTVKTAVYIQHLFMVGFMLYRYCWNHSIGFFFYFGHKTIYIYITKTYLWIPFFFAENCKRRSTTERTNHQERFRMAQWTQLWNLLHMCCWHKQRSKSS